MNLQPHTWQTYFRDDPVITYYFIINYTLNMKTKNIDKCRKILFNKSVMQHALGKLGPNLLFPTQILPCSEDIQTHHSKSPLLNNVFRHTFRCVVIQTLCTLRLRTHWYYVALLKDWDTDFRSSNPLSDTVTWNNLPSAVISKRIEDHFNSNNSRGMRQGIKPGYNKCATATTPPDSTLSDTLNFERRPHTPQTCPVLPALLWKVVRHPQIQNYKTAQQLLPPSHQSHHPHLYSAFSTRTDTNHTHTYVQ